MTTGPYQRILAFDFGTKRIGVACGQTISTTATPLGALAAHDGVPDYRDIEALLQEWKPDSLLVGLPLNMDGSKQALTHRAVKFGRRLHGRFGLPVVMHDERMTSVSAREELFDREGYRGLKKRNIDSLAACLILESWFAEQSTRGADQT